MSLRLRLTLTLGVTFVLLWLLAAGWMLHGLRAEMMHSLDQRLASSAQMVAGLLEQMPELKGREPNSGFSAQSLGIPDGLTCQINSLRGEVIAHSDPGREAQLDAGQTGFRNQVIQDRVWRTYTFEQHGLRITTADRLDEREALQGAVLLAAAVPVLLALLGTLLLLWLGVRKGLQPLRQMTDAIVKRGPDTLAPIELEPLPAELRPLLESQNRLFDRIAQTLERERRFTGDAAHELRSPLTAIKTHLQVAAMTEGEVSRQALSQAELGADRLQATLEQLLLLAQVEGQQSFDDGRPSTAEDTALAAIADAGAIIGKDVVMTMDQASAQTLSIPAPLATAALRNLLENALRHTAEGSPVELTISYTPGWAVFDVRDFGVGVEEEHLNLLTRRFWRRGQGQGSGLGLAIVEAIVQRCGCRLVFQPAAPGTRVILEIPLAT